MREGVFIKCGEGENMLCVLCVIYKIVCVCTVRECIHSCRVTYLRERLPVPSATMMQAHRASTCDAFHKTLWPLCNLMTYQLDQRG